MKKRNVLWVLFVFWSVWGCSTSDQSPRDVLRPKNNSHLDARLQRFLRTPELEKRTKPSVLSFPHGEPTVDVLIQTSGNTETLLLPGVIPRTRIGNVVTATVTRSGLLALARKEGITYVEPSIRLKRRNDIGTSASSGIAGTLQEGKPNFYSYGAKKGQVLTISMYAEDQGEIDPYLKICQESPCKNILAENDDVGDDNVDAQLTVKFPSEGEFYIFASDVDEGEGNYKLVLHDDPEYKLVLLDDPGYGAFRLGIGAKEVHASGNEGQGVIVGVIDSGIDWCHEDFIDDATGQSRILSIWDQNLIPQEGESAADVGNDGISANDYGVEYTQSQINTALADCNIATTTHLRVRSADTEGHGTHVAGTAAGDGSATNEPVGKYKGVAPKADLIIVKDNTDEATLPMSESAGLMDAIAYIFAEAERLNKPAVINMSLGSHDGPIDGTSLLDQAVRNATGPGRIIVAAAGNEGSDAIHAEGNIPINGSDKITFNLSKCIMPDCTEVAINLWHSGGDAYTAILTGPNGQTLSANHGNTTSGTVNGVLVEIANATSAPPNGDKNILVILGGSGSYPFDWSLTLQRTANGEDGKWDAWILPDDGASTFSSHSTTYPDDSFKGTVGELASSFGAITVGAHSTKFRWENQDEEIKEMLLEDIQDFGNIAPFSSRGPTRDGRIKPDLTAPGNMVMSALSADCVECDSSFISLDGTHIIASGTSMATPMVTGAVALILQADPTNFPRPLLKNTAVHDALTGSFLPNNTWGAGKVDVARAINTLNKDTAPTVSLMPTGYNENGQFEAIPVDLDSGDRIAEYLWDFENDGFTDAITTTSAISHTYTVGSLLTAKVTVVDSFGKTASATVAVTGPTTTTAITTVLPITTTTSATTTMPLATTTMTTVVTTTTLITVPPTVLPLDDVAVSGGGCFIATAAYGSYLDPHVQTLRVFRDNVLLQSSWGKTFVAFYYRGSPPLARFISDRPVLRGMTRLALTPVVFAVEQPYGAGGVMILGAVILSARLFRRRK